MTSKKSPGNGYIRSRGISVVSINKCYTDHMKKIIALYSVYSVLFFGAALLPVAAHAQQEDDQGTQQDVLSITAQAEEGVMNALPQSVKDFFMKAFHGVEEFRLRQVATATVKRDELQAQLEIAQNDRNEATDENRDEVLEGESTSLFSGAGERFTKGAPLGLFVKYYAYKFYTMFVSSPVIFYLLGSFIIIYIIGTLFNRARRGRE